MRAQALIDSLRSERGKRFERRVSTPTKENGNERNRTRLCSSSFVPYLSKKTCLDPRSILGLASRIGTNGISCTCHGQLVSTSIYGGVHLHQIICYLFPFGRAVRSSQNKKKGVQHFFFLFLEIPCFSWAALDLYSFPTTDQHQFMRQIIFHYSVFVPMLSGGGLRHTLTAL